MVVVEHGGVHWSVAHVVDSLRFVDSASARRVSVGIVTSLSHSFRLGLYGSLMNNFVDICIFFYYDVWFGLLRFFILIILRFIWIPT